MITVDALQHAINQRVDDYNQTDYPLTSRPIALHKLSDSLNHILAEDVVSGFDIPRQNLSAMDGFAFATGSDISSNSHFEIVGESQAGAPFSGQLSPGQGIRIFTGAVVPNGCDTVEMQENTNFDSLKTRLDKSQAYQITLTQDAKIGNNIRRQGEEIQQGEVVLHKGKRLNPTDISLLANLGVAEVSIYEPLTVGVLATGDELVAVGQSLTSLAQIYNSNTPTLKSLLADLPMMIKDYGIAPDDLAQTRQIITNAMTECDVIISTAGVSVGDYDFLTTVVEELGHINHYKVAMKPGKPFVFGELTKNSPLPVLYFGLPGNPLSTVVGTLQFVIPALWRLTGIAHSDLPMRISLQAKLINDIRKSPGRVDFQRGLLQQDNTGGYQVSVFNSQQSHRIKQLSHANCLVKLPQDSGNLSAGCTVEVQPFPWRLY